MDRRSGLKKAHFSSVPTRMSLFTCKKYVFLIDKNFPKPFHLPPHPKIGKTQHNVLLKLNASLPKGRSAGRVGKLNTTLSYGSRCGVGTKFYRGFVVILTDLY
ncbi:hypothetical protein LEP1GSC104_3322 [Leptospira interrogans str. UI 12621]|uniref:Uncharacterized protein n=1 Tax=Leptospira interrogans str. UI 12621 TaxID=1049937 RepID=A0A0F6HD08_LEPIR|nr:hypothetical protein LEP1GSC104_3322 [Leptospira interrogans str. UI 12621]